MDSAGRGAYFRQLFISGRRAQRARTPNFGFLRIDGPSPKDKDAPFALKYRGQDVKPEWAGTDAEVIALLAWADIRMPIVSVDSAARIATLANNPRPSNRETDARYYIENTPDSLDSAESGIWTARPESSATGRWRERTSQKRKSSRPL